MIWFIIMATLGILAAIGISTLALLKANKVEEVENRLLDKLEEYGATIAGRPKHEAKRSKKAMSEESNPLVYPPPTLPDGTTVWDWLVHYTGDPEKTLWSVVDEFYLRETSDSITGPYFVNMDIPAQKKKFHATLVIVLKTGVRRSAIAALQNAHAGVCTPDGTPITDQAVTRTSQILGGVLDDARVPPEAIRAIADTIEHLREILVVDDTEPESVDVR